MESNPESTSSVLVENETISNKCPIEFSLFVLSSVLVENETISSKCPIEFSLFVLCEIGNTFV